MAVEVHQQKPSSSDIRFDLEMEAFISAGRFVASISTEERAKALSDLESLLPGSYGQPWRRHWSAAVMAEGGTEEDGGIASSDAQEEAFCRRVQRILNDGGASVGR